ncbi:hypothetical protein [Geodermatophilus ruber]|uniref:Uncharacterized protein n=1 Tax=Geodermatophilus ruber TaxID=504800 RepID=A0A1I4BZK7_9ACTN|nr:hypothetical protein [Geodermatophilus ruber]SFK74115.1 hypothetical protein SAMN04488085_103271 [Geodermatophilus ruber]
MSGNGEQDDDGEKYRIELAPGLSDAQRAEAERIFAALRRTRRERHQRADEAAATGEPAPTLPLCPTLLISAEPCLLPLVDGQDCPHREPGPVPDAVRDLVVRLRREVAEARQVASRLGSLVRDLRGGRGIESALKRKEPWWLVPGEPEAPPT